MPRVRVEILIGFSLQHYNFLFNKPTDLYDANEINNILLVVKHCENNMVFLTKTK